MDNSSVTMQFDIIALSRFALYLIIGYFSARISSRAFIRFTQSKLSPHHVLLGKMGLFYSIFALFIVSGLRHLGFDFSLLLGAAGVLSVALAFASQTSASNLISGLFMLAEKPFQIGDVIRIDTLSGEVIGIDLLSVKLRTFDNLMIRVPNETLIKSTFINVSRFPIRRIDLPIGIAYNANIEQAQACLINVVEQHFNTLEHPEPICVVTQFNASSIDLQLSAWVAQTDFLNTKSELFIAAKKALDDAKIEIPFPHTTLHASSGDNPIPISVHFSDNSSEAMIKNWQDKSRTQAEQPTEDK